MNNEKEKNKEVFEHMPIPKALATLAIPTIIGQLIVLIYNLADTFYIGRINNPMMVAGVSLILPVFNISVSLAGLAGVGGGSLISRLLGIGREGEARKVCSFSFYLSILLALLFSTIMGAFSTPILNILGATPDTILYAQQYSFWVIVVGAVPTVMSMTMSNLLRSIGCAKQAGFGVSMGGLLNIGLDPLFMFVLFPKGLEIVGVGAATMCSNVITCIYFFIVIMRMRKRTVLSLSPFEGIPGRKEIGSIFAVGIPAAIATLLFDLDYIVIDKLATGYGDIPLAAIGIVLKAERLPLNIGIGLCQGIMPIVAYNYAAGNYERMKVVMRYSRFVGLVVATLSIILYELFATQIMRIFIDDAETVRIGIHFLQVRCLATPFMFLCFHMVFLFQAFGLGNRSLLLAVVRWAVFNIPMLFILNAVLGMYGIVWTQMCADILTVIVSFYVYYQFEKSFET